MKRIFSLDQRESKTVMNFKSIILLQQIWDQPGHACRWHHLAPGVNKHQVIRQKPALFDVHFKFLRLICQHEGGGACSCAATSWICKIWDFVPHGINTALFLRIQKFATCTNMLTYQRTGRPWWRLCCFASCIAHAGSITSFPHQPFPHSVFELWPAFNFGLDPSSRGVWERPGGEVTLNSCTFSLVKILPSSGKFRAFSKFSGRTRATFRPWPPDTKPLAAVFHLRLPV